MVWLCVHNKNIQFHHIHILHVSINHTGAQEKYYVYLHYLSISFVCAMWCDSFLSEPETLFVCLLSEMRVNLLFTQNVFVCFSRWVSASLTISLFVSFMIMSNFFLWNSARHFFHHGLCDLRSSCRISMHQLGCQDLWHTHKLKMEMEMLIKQQRERRNVVDFSTVTIDDLRSWARPLEIETVQLLK